MPQPPHINVDPEFWDRLRGTLRTYMKANRIKQKELAPRLAIEPTTLSNFLNGQSKALGGLAVALACTLADVVCDGKRIGRLGDNLSAGTGEKQLVLEFDQAFELNQDGVHPSMILRKPPGADGLVRLALKRIG
jgi:transcriptional regulator with XRE-family HTH domain